ncbi:MAG: tetratricopeptide repeat protein [Methanomicrobiales archaeon]
MVDISHIFTEANGLLEDKEYKKALDLFDKIITDDPDNLEAHLKKGLCLTELGEFDDAVRTYEKVIKLDPLNQKAVEGEKEAESRHLIVKTIKQASPDAVVILPAGHDNDYEDWLSGRDKEVASFKQAQNVYSQDPQDRKALIHMGNFYQDEGMYDKLVIVYEQVLKSYPDDYSALFNKGVALAYNDQFGPALDVFEETEKIENLRYNSIINQGFCLTKLKKYDPALGCYERAVKDSPQRCEAYFNKANLLLDNFSREKAMKFIKSFILDENIKISHNSRISSLAFIGEHEEARKYSQGHSSGGMFGGGMIRASLMSYVDDLKKYHDSVKSEADEKKWIMDYYMPKWHRSREITDYEEIRDEFRRLRIDSKDNIPFFSYVELKED